LAYEDAKLYAVSNLLRTHLMIVEALRSRAESAPVDQGLLDVIAALSMGATYGDANEDGDFDGSHGYPPGDPRRQSHPPS
jgi:hypothetical protein